MKQELKKKIIQKKYLEGNQNIKTLVKNNTKKTQKQKEVQSQSPTKVFDKKTATLFKNKIKKKKKVKNLKTKLSPCQSKRRKQTEIDSLEELYKQKTIDNAKRQMKQQDMRLQKTFRKIQNKQKPQKSTRKTVRTKDNVTKRLKKSVTRKTSVQPLKKTKLKSQGSRKKKIKYHQEKKLQQDQNIYQKLKKNKSQPIIERMQQLISIPKNNQKFKKDLKQTSQKEKLLCSERQQKYLNNSQDSLNNEKLNQNTEYIKNQKQKILQQQDQMIFKRNKKKNQEQKKNQESDYHLLKNLTIRNVYQINNYKKKPQQVILYNQRKKINGQQENLLLHQQNNSIQQILKISESKKNRAKIILQFKTISAITIQRWWRKQYKKVKQLRYQNVNQKSQVEQLKKHRPQQVNQLRQIIQVYDTIQNEQKNKWKSLYLQIKNIEKKQKDNPIIQQIKKQSLQNLKLIQGKKNQLELQNNKQFRKQNFSLDDKIQEKFVDQKCIQTKNSYLDFRKKIQQQHISKSMVILKKSFDRSFDLTLSHLNIKIKKQQKNQKTKSKIKEKKVQPRTQKDNDLCAKKITHEIIIQEINEIFQEINFQKFQKNKVSFPTVQTDIFTIHTFLNQVSEFLIFNHLNSIKNRLNSYFSISCNQNKNKILQDQFFKYYYQEHFNQNEDHQKFFFNKMFRKCIYDTLDISMFNQIVNPFPGIIKFNFFCTNFSEQNQISSDLEKSIYQTNKNIYDDIGTISALEKACNQLLNWNDIMCGVIIKEQDLIDQKEQQQYLKQIREERLQKLVENDMKDQFCNQQDSKFNIITLLSEISEDILSYLMVDLIDFLKI